MDKIKVGFVCNTRIAVQCAAFEELNIVYDASDAYSALACQRQQKAEVIVCELLVPQMDGFTLIEQITALQPKASCIVLTELNSQVFMEKAYNAGACQYLVKPYDVNALVLAIRHATTKKTAPVLYKSELAKTLDERLSNIFITVGIPAHIKGYQFLRDGVKLAVDNPTIINSITKSLYPAIASMHSTTASKVERAIRHAIEVAWNRGKIENINSLFGVKIYSTNEKPTNGEFIALLADKMLLECAY